MTERLERVRNIADDLSREFIRNYKHSLGVRAMAKQLRDDAAAVIRELKRAKH
jgi:hypothetical protein